MNVLKFGAVWCPACLIMKPRWKEIETEYPQLKTEYFDFDEASDAVKQYGITEELPTFVFLDDDGKELLRLNGEIEKKKLIEIIRKYTGQAT